MTPHTLLLWAALLPSADIPIADASAKDLAKMQGDWMVVSITSDGRKLSDDEAQTLFRTVYWQQVHHLQFQQADQQRHLQNRRDQDAEDDRFDAGRTCQSRDLSWAFTSSRGTRSKFATAARDCRGRPNSSAKEGSNHTENRLAAGKEVIVSGRFDFQWRRAC